jgi:RimJ/RimL family protein N-acetyltransferase
MSSDPFDLQPTLEGPTLLVRPLTAEDLEPLYAAASDPEIWALHPEPTRWQRDVFTNGFFAGALASGSAFTVIDRRTSAIIGSSRYYEYDPSAKTIFVGYTFLTRAYWGGATNRELKQLMLDHAFLQMEAVLFHIGPANWRSRRAVEKIGGTFVREEVVMRNGTPEPRVIYRIDRLEWLAKRGSNMTPPKLKPFVPTKGAIAPNGIRFK